ncbi:MULTISPECIES: hypothetical protein [unclassified Candidatus Frackibacter]|uniref:hypothetical protein n=1 Tax=unclassified Candidatus Frackibacter TaxID=2648818 RepID=UPI0007952FBE|nr:MULTISPECIES: hypothetical protein [unclassified Candidatus Frackibacter]KXS44710.1 MAG: hypothetical protein AWU54_705 [Candidatus Frackibacter sp. T328-2]SDC51944.1 hypothetical protein SAMN04515661_11269 [Candidatus Frackibacter sp. WG11]SEM41262.1 hypothetical protein SAMN04488698_10368 [Candidatus Frackibacter sp. WG12]SFL75897.1 hypothetical protein SAMN04488699_11266 [Candidatus Frackibacter sp. WG13]
MSRGFYDFVIRLIERIESLLIKGTIALIILLITVQVALNDPLNVNLKLSELPVVEKVLTYLPLEKLDLEYQQTQQGVAKHKEASRISSQVMGEKKGLIELTVLNLDQVNQNNIRIIVNGKRIDNFIGNQIQIFVSDGDRVIVDTRGVQRGLWFKVTDISGGIQNFRVGEQIWIQDNLKSLGRVEFQKRY